MVENAENDRITSNQTVKQLQDGHGAPDTQAAQELWVTSQVQYFSSDYTKAVVGQSILWRRSYSFL